MPASSKLPSATCSLASASSPSPPRRRRRVASLMGQSPSAPSGRNRSRSSQRWPQPGLRLDLGFLLGRKPWQGGERLDLANWMRCFLSPPLPPPTAEAEAEANAEGKAAGSREEEEVGGEEADHLVVMVNGLYGSSADWKFAAEQFVKRLPGKVFVHRSQCNHSKLTYDGVDLMGERLAEEVRQVVRRRRNLRKISFVAHSLGGLVTRYAIGKLYEPSINEVSSLDTDKLRDEQKRSAGGKIAGLEPINFITSATPHLGSCWNKQLPFLFGVPLLEKTAAGTAHFIVGRTGRHLFLTDRDDGKPPLLLRMVEDCDDGKFMSALHSFKRRVAYANITYDHIVGWRTSSIRRQYEFPKLKLTAQDEKYPHVINVDKGNSEDHQQEESVEDSLVDSLEELMIRGLRQVTWERVDVCFHKSWLRYNAHNNIQAINVREQE
ncbi:putative lipase C4A8.10 isoform X2 [Phragmites australis]|uniref:putative lipase C4A8.10 isoform X2 n=1 Tax=Phragmites australis TaxID=29695 RepID=UPI002D774D01|nr:putative lipase C4A8.10 isoform X2 [Phragmites australis]